MDEFRAAAMPFAQTLAASLGGAQTDLVPYHQTPPAFPGQGVWICISSRRRWRSPCRISDYSPVARVKDQATGVLVRRKGAELTTVALTEKESWLDVMARYTLKRNNQDSVKILNFKTQEDVSLAMERNHAQAGSLRSKAAEALVAKGDFEVWHPLPSTPDFTLMASNRLTSREQNKLGAAAVALNPYAVQSLQKTIRSKETGFVIDGEADYKVIKLALKDAGC